ncbi:MAG: L,D-transpeptidase family protein [Bdellovibrionota bacterium]
MKTLWLFIFLFQIETWAQTTFSPFVFVPPRWENRTLIFVDKKIRKLFVYKVQNGKPISIFETEADFGKNDGFKTKRDDHKTPEGIYFPQTHLTAPAIPFNLYGNRAFTLDYPNLIDRTEGKTGSGIWIHSVPDNVPLTRGSRGCVVIRNKSIDELKSYVTLKETPVIIQSSDAIEDEEASKAEVTTFLDTWKEAWISKDIDKYIQYYSADFKNPGYNVRTWKDYKRKITDGSGEISIDFEEILTLKGHNQYVISFVQKYKSEKLQDIGLKTLWLKKEDKNLKIIREDWNKIEQNAALLGLSKASDE